MRKHLRLVDCLVRGRCTLRWRTCFLNEVFEWFPQSATEPTLVHRHVGTRWVWIVPDVTSALHFFYCVQHVTKSVLKREEISRRCEVVVIALATEWCAPLSSSCCAATDWAATDVPQSWRCSRRHWLGARHLPRTTSRGTWRFRSAQTSPSGLHGVLFSHPGSPQSHNPLVRVSSGFPIPPCQPPGSEDLSWPAIKMATSTINCITNNLYCKRHKKAF